VLGLGKPTEDAVDGDGVALGDVVAVHWDRLVDVLTPDQAEVLRTSTRARLAATNARLAVAAG
jgi:hypothetical protein